MSPLEELAARLKIQNAVRDPNFVYGRSATARAQPFRYGVIHDDVLGPDGLRNYTQTVDKNRGGAFGYHVMVNPDGSMEQIAPFDKRTNHLSPSSNARRGGVNADVSNHNALGVVMSGASGGKGTREQLESVRRLREELGGAGIKDWYTHGQLQPGTRASNEGMPKLSLTRDDLSGVASYNPANQGPNRPLEQRSLTARMTPPQGQSMAPVGGLQLADAPQTNPTTHPLAGMADGPMQGPPGQPPLDMSPLNSRVGAFASAQLAPSSQMAASQPPPPTHTPGPSGASPWTNPFQDAPVPQAPQMAATPPPDARGAFQAASAPPMPEIASAAPQAPMGDTFGPPAPGPVAGATPGLSFGGIGGALGGLAKMFGGDDDKSSQQAAAASQKAAAEADASFERDRIAHLQQFANAPGLQKAAMKRQADRQRMLGHPEDPENIGAFQIL